MDIGKYFIYLPVSKTYQIYSNSLYFRFEVLIFNK